MQSKQLEMPATLPEQAEWLVKTFDTTKALTVALAIGKSSKWVKTRWRFLVLPPEMQKAARDGKLSEKDINKLTTYLKPDTRQHHFERMMKR